MGCYSPRGRKESDTTEHLYFHLLQSPGKTTVPLEKNSFASAQEKKLKKRRKFMGSCLFLNIQNKLERVTHAYVQFRTKLVIELGSD